MQSKSIFKSKIFRTQVLTIVGGIFALIAHQYEAGATMIVGALLTIFFRSNSHTTVYLKKKKGI